jgi:SAM-dependent methyltransferase
LAGETVPDQDVTTARTTQRHAAILAAAFAGLAILRTRPDVSASDVVAFVDAANSLRLAIDDPFPPSREIDTDAGYSLWAQSYDRTPNPLLVAELPLARRLLRALRPGTTLDAACGTGRHAEFLARLGHNVIGVDANGAMLDVARRAAPGATFHQASLTDIPLPACSVDAAVCALALTHAPNLAPPLAELVRVLKPGGRLIVTDVHPTTALLGGHALVPAGDDVRWMRTYVHDIGEYVTAINEHGLTINACETAPYNRASVALIAEWLPPRFASLAEIWLGLPAILAWDLGVPIHAA